MKKRKRKEKKIIREQNINYIELETIVREGQFEKMTELKLRKQHANTLEQKLDDQKKATAEAKEKLEEEKDKLLQCVKDKKIMEKDREETREAWKKLMLKEDIKFLDEIAGIGFESKRRKSEDEKSK